MKTKHIQKLSSIASGILIMFIAGCEKFVEVDLPSSKLTTGAVFQSDATATAATLAMYESMLRSTSFGASGAPASISTIAGVYADEFANYYLPNQPFADNNVLPAHSTILSLWSSMYTTIYTANSVIEGLEGGIGVTLSLRNQLMGEALFVRAFCHFYLTSLYGDVPLVLSTDYRQNERLARSRSAVVYDQIIEDLTLAESLLGTSYIGAERARPSSWSAKALKARIYLYIENWEQAASTASELIDNAGLFRLEADLDSVFLKGSREAIWQLSSTRPTSYNTYEGQYYILTSAPQLVGISETLQQAFEPEDQRYASWVGLFETETAAYHFPFKYKVKGPTTPLMEHSVVLRLAEQYLIRAEARAHMGLLNGENGASSDLALIRTRAGLPASPIASESEALMAVAKERQVELFGEWGHRWLDLRRVNLAEAVLGPLKPHWETRAALFPLPETELINNPVLAPQNSGY